MLVGEWLDGVQRKNQTSQSVLRYVVPLVCTDVEYVVSCYPGTGRLYRTVVCTAEIDR